jgi:ABC-type branched-subunit amino acid transport system substrate-binding protein
MKSYGSSRMAPLAIAVGASMVLAGLAWSGPAEGASGAPGVSATQINIGAISSRTGPLAGYFGGIAPGMIAYFKTLDATGGINGRKIVMTNNLDDGGSPTQFGQDARNLIQQDHVFAVGVASAWFTPNFFVDTQTPTYGYNVSANWENAPNLFAVGGSTQIYASGFPTLAFFVKKVKAKSLAIISYGAGIASSYDACSAYAKGMTSAGVHVSFVDSEAQLGGSYSSNVQRLRQSGADLVMTCLQASDNVTLARDIQQYGLKIKQLWLNGYDQALLNQYSNLMQGVYLTNTASVPFAAGTLAKYGNTYPGMKQYIASMKKYEPSFVYNGVAFQGWQSAALLAAGIRAAGNNLTQANVVNATNNMTNFTAGGLSAPVNWKVDHVSYTVPNCSAYLQVQGKQFVPVFGQSKQVFVCVGSSFRKPTQVTPPKGTPGT